MATATNGDCGVDSETPLFEIGFVAALERRPGRGLN
jgi:hypothetical protein